MLGSSKVGAQLAASQEGLTSMGGGGDDDDNNDDDEPLFKLLWLIF
jgi:hypothetical protein